MIAHLPFQFIHEKDKTAGNPLQYRVFELLIEDFRSQIRNIQKHSSQTRQLSIFLQMSLAYTHIVKFRFTSWKLSIQSAEKKAMRIWILEPRQHCRTISTPFKYYISIAFKNQ